MNRFYLGLHRGTRVFLVLQVGRNVDDDFFDSMAGNVVDVDEAVAWLPSLFPGNHGVDAHSSVAQIWASLGGSHRGSGVTASLTLAELRDGLARRLRRREARLIRDPQAAPQPLTPVDAPVAKVAHKRWVVRGEVEAITTGWYCEQDPEHFVPAKLTVRIDDTCDGAPSTSYAGKGTLGISDGILLFSDEVCTADAEVHVAAAKLREGITLYAKGFSVGAFTVSLKLTPQDKYLVAGANDAVKIDAVNVITAHLLPDPIALLHHHGCPDHRTSLSELKLRIEQSNRSHPCQDLQATLSYGGQIECYPDADMQAAYASGQTVEAAQLPEKLVMKGKQQGECPITLKLASDAAKGDKSYKLTGDATGAVWVEKLELGAFKYLEGRSHKEQSYKTVKISATPKVRELHNENDKYCTPDGPGERSVPGRMFVKKPADRVWEFCDAVTLDTVGQLDIRLGQKPAAKRLEFTMADFSEDELAVTVIARGDTSLDPEEGNAGEPVDWKAWQKSEPEKPIRPCYVTCGVRDKQKQLRHGDVLQLDTFTFDFVLDRMTRNECGEHCKPDPARKALYQDVAFAKAGGHRYYDLIGEARLNKVHPPPHKLTAEKRAKTPTDLRISAKDELMFSSAMLEAFILALEEPGSGATVDDWVKAGVSYISKHLKQRWGISLHETMRKEMIGGFIRRTLEANVKRTEKDGDAIREQNDKMPANRSTRAELRWVADSRGKAEQRRFYYGFDDNWGVPGTHAEVLTVNDMLNKGLSRAEITVATYKCMPTKPTAGKQQGRRFLACANCAGILVPHVRVVTG